MMQNGFFAVIRAIFFAFKIFLYNNFAFTAHKELQLFFLQKED